jgi:hypothetical protein
VMPAVVVSCCGRDRTRHAPHRRAAHRCRICGRCFADQQTYCVPRGANVRACVRSRACLRVCGAFAGLCARACACVHARARAIVCAVRAHMRTPACVRALRVRVSAQVRAGPCARSQVHARVARACARGRRCSADGPQGPAADVRAERAPRTHTHARTRAESGPQSHARPHALTRRCASRSRRAPRRTCSATASGPRPAHAAACRCRIGARRTRTPGPSRISRRCCPARNWATRQPSKQTKARLNKQTNKAQQTYRRPTQPQWALAPGRALHAASGRAQRGVTADKVCRRMRARGADRDASI